MNIEDMIKNMNPQMLSNALNKMNSILSPEQMAQVEKAIKTTDKGELNKKLKYKDLYFFLYGLFLSFQLFFYW